MENFSALPSTARVWVYQSDRAFTTTESAQVVEDIRAFVSQWLAHKAKVIGDGVLLFDRFVVLAADEEKLQVSGCSIDSTVRFIKDLGQKYGINFFDRFYTCYLENGEVKGVDFESFKQLYASHKVTDDTVVFNNLLTTVEVLNTNWQQPLSQSWHRKFVTQEAAAFKL